MGTVILMLIMGYGIGMDVESLRFAVLDRDQTVSSQAWTLNLSGSRYLSNSRRSPVMTSLIVGCVRAISRWPLKSAQFGRDIARGTPVELGVSMNGAMPSRAETVKGYVQAMHRSWLQMWQPTIDTRQPKRADEH